MLSAVKARSSAQAGRASLCWLGWILKVLVSTFVVWFIYQRIQSAQLELGVWNFLSLEVIHWPSAALIFLLSMVLMMFNWGMEVIKWKHLIDRQHSITWRTATKGVLSGVSFGVFSPNRTGEFIGRILSLRPEQRVMGTLMSFVNGLAQTTATFAFGLVGMILLLTLIGEARLGMIPNMVLRMTLLLTLILLVLIYYRLPHLGPWLAGFNKLSRWKPQLTAMVRLSSETMTKLLYLSLLRFMTFIAQYMLLFFVVFESPQWLGLLGSSILTLFSSTLLPFLPIPDLLLRETFALGYFELFSFDPVKVSVVVFGVWLINVALPAMLGTLVLFTYRIFKRRT